MMQLLQHGPMCVLTRQERFIMTRDVMDIHSGMAFKLHFKEAEDSNKRNRTSDTKEHSNALTKSFGGFRVRKTANKGEAGQGSVTPNAS
jgi:hypothetical protein